MPIIQARAPQASLSALYPHLGTSFISTTAGARSANLTAASPKISDPHPCYCLGLNEVAQGNFLSTASLESWNYLLLNGDQPIGNAEMLDTGTNTLAFSSISHNFLAADLLNALHVVEGAAAVQKGNYEMRLLRIPSLYFAALWLHASTDDLIFPIAPTPNELASQRIYTAAEILPNLMSAANAKRAAYDADQTAQLGG